MYDVCNAVWTLYTNSVFGLELRKTAENLD
jgi:hypothetical protein